MNEQLLNGYIANAFNYGISSFCYFDGAKGDSIDNMIVNAIIKYCPLIDIIELPEWKKGQQLPLYKPIRSGVQAMANTRYCDCSELKFGSCYDRPLLIRQPNNTQQFPDILIVYKNKGMCIEIKSSKHDQIIWNSGLPRKNAIYIYNGTPRGTKEALSDTTFFLGQCIISDTERDILYKASNENHDTSKEYNKALIGSGWSLYARPMFNYTGAFLSNELRKGREHDVKEFINNFQWG